MLYSSLPAVVRHCDDPALKMKSPGTRISVRFRKNAHPCMCPGSHQMQLSHCASLMRSLESRSSWQMVPTYAVVTRNNLCMEPTFASVRYLLSVVSQVGDYGVENQEFQWLNPDQAGEWCPPMQKVTWCLPMQLLLGVHQCCCLLPLVCMMEIMALWIRSPSASTPIKLGNDAHLCGCY